MTPRSDGGGKLKVGSVCLGHEIFYHTVYIVTINNTESETWIFKMYCTCIMVSTIAIPIGESVDSLCRDGADTPIPPNFPTLRF